MTIDPALQALNRFGLGARPGEKHDISEPRGWVLEQLDRPPSAPSAERAHVDASNALGDLRAAQSSGDREAAARARRRITAITAAEMAAALEQRVTTDAPVVERLTAFWSNHLCVSMAGKVVVAALAGAYEREAIRPHVLGRFEDMVLASAMHPAMLLYLDNAQSIGPASPAARRQRARAGARRGLNENYARELLELHTLGVDGGYTQGDVQELARILTGWTVTGRGGARPGVAGAGVLRFAFDPLLHEPGSKVVLGTDYGEAGVEEGRRAIRALCRHPATSRFIADKLVRHFVSDTPPPATVAAVARAFADSDGDLRVTTRALVEHPDAWSGQARKFRSPQDWLIAVLRALDIRRAGALPPLLRQLRHPMWSPPAPNGFGDTAREWADPDSLLNRAELARTVARRVPPGLDPRTLLDVVETAATDPLRDMLADDTIDNAERVALALAAPAFQWR
ncbi:MAG TPA: DUF1800 domain-containing protein [Longimicrobiales bacterium]|nr:DUF1800 domain-containing protein [Longimicrobiales bacterium]